MVHNARSADLRTFPRCLLAFALCFASCRGTPQATPPPKTRILIDVHAHVLHGEDVPLRAFGEKVVGLPSWLARLVERWLIGDGEARVRFQQLKDTEDAVPEAKVRNLLQVTLRDLAPEARALTAPKSTAMGDPAREKETEQSDRELQLNLQTLLEQKDWRLTSPEMLPDVERFEAKDIDPCRPARLTIIDTMQGLIRFAAILDKDTPSKVADVYYKTFGFDADKEPYVELVVPSMMSMDSWLGEHSKHTIPMQIDELGVLVKEKAGRLHPFFAFDPCESWPESKRQLQHALDLGFIGVKVYPPLGYLPYGNATHHPACPPLPCADATIDQNFEELYSHCDSEGIPIMAHCSDPGAAACPKAGENANPVYWEPVLRAHPGLRLSFGHFGGGDFIGPRGWTLTIIHLMQSYPNVYADLAYHAWPFDPTARECYNKALHLLLGGTDKDLLAQRMMFGTDWSMISREPWQREYVSELLHIVAVDFPKDLDGIAGVNALNYLGLVRDAPNYARLMKYYAANHIDPKAVPWVRAVESMGK